MLCVCSCFGMYTCLLFDLCLLVVRVFVRVSRVRLFFVYVVRCVIDAVVCFYGVIHVLVVCAVLSYLFVICVYVCVGCFFFLLR